MLSAQKSFVAPHLSLKRKMMPIEVKTLLLFPSQQPSATSVFNVVQCSRSRFIWTAHNFGSTSFDPSVPLPPYFDWSSDTSTHTSPSSNQATAYEDDILVARSLFHRPNNLSSKSTRMG